MTLEAGTARSLSESAPSPLARLRLPDDWSSRLRRLLPLAVGALLVLALTGVLRQLAHPFLAHDDWYFVLPVDGATDDSMLDRVLWEGRWLNYAWWRGPGHLLSSGVAAVLFTLGYLLLVLRLAWRWAPGWLAVPTVLALFTSPMVADLASWPATLALPFCGVAGAAFALPWCAEKPRRLAVWVVLATSLTFLSYPPLTLIVLVVLVVELIDRELRDLVLVTLLFGVTYVLTTLLVFTLNLIAFGKFGLEVLPWRRPNPVHGLGDLGENLQRTGTQVVDLATLATIPLALGTLGVLGCLLLPALRARGLRLLLLVGVVLAVQSSSTVLMGVSTPFRSTGWVWLVAVLALVWVAAEVGVHRLVRLGAAAALVAVGLWGARYWYQENDRTQDLRVTYDAVVDRVADRARETPDDRVLLVGTAADWLDYDFRTQSQYLELAALERYGIEMRRCRPPGCAVAGRLSVLARADRGFRVFRSNRILVVVAPAHRRSGVRDGVEP